MAKKTLNEAVVRRFQKLANLAPINEMYGKNEEYMQEEEEMNMDTEEVDMKMDAEEAPEMKMNDEETEEAETESGELELTDDEAKSALEAIKDLEELATKLEAAMGELDLDTEDEGEEMNMDMDMEEEEVDTMLEGISYERSQKEIVNEVAKRVAKRLESAKLHESKLNRALSRK